MPSINVATIKARKTTIVKIKNLAVELSISQLDVLDLLVDSFKADVSKIPTKVLENA